VTRRGQFLSVEQCGSIYRALNRDVSGRLAASAAAGERSVAAQRCHIGQPVAVPISASASAGTLRISAGARVVSETWRAEGESESRRKLAEELEQVRVILDKIDLLVENLDALSGRDEPATRDLRRQSAQAHSAPQVEISRALERIERARCEPRLHQE
jgi:hypothetical protein